MSDVLERRQALSELTIGQSAWPVPDQDGSTENDAGNAPVLVGSSFAKCTKRSALGHECQFSCDPLAPRSQPNLRSPHSSWLSHYFRAGRLRGLVSHKEAFHSLFCSYSVSLSTNGQTADSILCHGRSHPFASVNRNESIGPRRSSVPGGILPAGIPDGPCLEIAATFHPARGRRSVFRDH